jgi:site-specific DNA-methyltransferase (adenine-specific)
MLKKISQDAMRGVYSLVPLQDFTLKLSDKKLYDKYKISNKEIEFIESMVRAIQLENE